MWSLNEKHMILYMLCDSVKIDHLIYWYWWMKWKVVCIYI